MGKKKQRKQKGNTLAQDIDTMERRHLINAEYHQGFSEGQRHALQSVAELMDLFEKKNSTKGEAIPEQPPTHSPDTHYPQLPNTLTYPTGLTIDTEELIQQLSLLKKTLQHHLDFFGQEPPGYPEIHAMYNISSSAYLALAGTFYATEIKNNPNYNYV